MATIERYQTKSGATLYAVRYRKPDNKQTWKRGFATKREAAEFANTVEVDKLRGQYISPVLGKTTIGELGPAWLERQRGHLKPSVFLNEESVWRVWVEPRWATTRHRRHPLQRGAGVGCRVIRTPERIDSHWHLLDARADSR